MTAHRHQDSRKLWTTSVTDPDLSPYAKGTDLIAALARIAALEIKVAALTPPPGRTYSFTVA